jgi:hypothetical protein
LRDDASRNGICDPLRFASSIAFPGFFTAFSSEKRRNTVVYRLSAKSKPVAVTLSSAKLRVWLFVFGPRYCRFCKVELVDAFGLEGFLSNCWRQSGSNDKA